jgi:hypothetical protein
VEGRDRQDRPGAAIGAGGTGAPRSPPATLLARCGAGGRSQDEVSWPEVDCRAAPSARLARGTPPTSRRSLAAGPAVCRGARGRHHPGAGGRRVSVALRIGQLAQGRRLVGGRGVLDGAGWTRRAESRLPPQGLPEHPCRRGAGRFRSGRPHRRLSGPWIGADGIHGDAASSSSGCPQGRRTVLARPDAPGLSGRRAGRPGRSLHDGPDCWSRTQGRGNAA